MNLFNFNLILAESPMYPIKIYIINLKKDTERKKHIQHLCAIHNLDIEFVDAVEGKILTREKILESYSESLALTTIGRKLTLGEIGCALSHQKIYQKMLNQNINEAIILEDDIEFQEKFLQIINNRKKFSKETELILLGYWHPKIKNKKHLLSYREKVPITNNYYLGRFIKNPYGTFGYYITLTGVQKLLNILNEKLTMPIDHYTNNEKYVNLYGIYPPVIHLSNTFDLSTSLEREREEAREKNMKYENIKKILKKLKILTLITNTKKSLITQKELLILFVKQFKKSKPYR